MKKKLLALTLTAAVVCACIPAMAGCSASAQYSLVEDESGKYYVASCSGFSSALTGTLEIPSHIDGIPVKEIAEKGFAAAGISKVIIPETVEVIQTAAFAYCSSLTGVEFKAGSTVSALGRGVFGYCTALREVSLPQSLTALGGMAFYQCSSLSSITLPDSIEFIGDRAFCLCSGLSEITLPANLKNLDYRSFYQCTGLESVTFNQGLEKIGVEAFSLCIKLKEVVVPSSVCDSEYVDEDGKTQIEAGIGFAAFQGCEKLEKAVILANVGSVKSATFGHCPALKEVWLPAGLQSVEGSYSVNGQLTFGHAFYSNSSLTDVYFAGTEQQWAAVNIDNTPLTDNGILSDNGALIRAAKHYGAVYGNNQE